MYSITSMGKNSAFFMIVSVLANLAEIERENIKEIQREGIAIAKAKGFLSWKITRYRAYG